MRGTLTIYLSRLLLGKLVLFGLGFVALFQVFDLLKNAGDVMARHGESFASLAYYAVLRLPGTVSFLLPLCVLVAALMTLSVLAQHNEITSFKAAGLSLYRFLLGFVPVAITIAAAHWLLSDQLVPAAQRALQQWDAESVVALGEGTGGGREIWVRSGRSVVRIAGVLDDGEGLVDLMLYERSGKGRLDQQLAARQASYRDGVWVLQDVERTVWPAAGPPQRSHLDQMAWETELIPGDLANLSAHPNGLTLRSLLEFTDASGLGQHPEYFYRTWVQKRIATPLTTLVMILLAASVAPTLVRGRSTASNFATGAGLGFLYLIADGVILTMGEAGSLPPALAAWVPLAVFGCIGGTILIAREGA